VYPTERKKKMSAPSVNPKVPFLRYRILGTIKGNPHQVIFEVPKDEDADRAVRLLNMEMKRRHEAYEEEEEYAESQEEEEEEEEEESAELDSEEEEPTTSDEAFIDDE
jgi:hypothetical protein